MHFDDFERKQNISARRIFYFDDVDEKTTLVLTNYSTQHLEGNVRFVWHKDVDRFEDNSLAINKLYTNKLYRSDEDYEWTENKINRILISNEVEREGTNLIKRNVNNERFSQSIKSFSNIMLRIDVLVSEYESDEKSALNEFQDLRDDSYLY